VKCARGSVPPTVSTRHADRMREAARAELWRSELTGMRAEQRDWELGREDDSEDES
jgi:hypothetical protein